MEPASSAAFDGRACAIIAAATLLAHFMAFTRGFVWDDINSIELARYGGGLKRLFEPDPFGYFRPGKSLMWALAHLLFGERAWLYQAASMVVVLGAGVAYHGLSRRWLSPAAALATALIYVCHPLHVEAAFWFSSLNGAILTLAGIIYSRLILRYNERFTPARAFVAALICLSALSLKEEAVVFPFAAALMLLSLGRRPSKSVIVQWVVVLAISAAYVAYARHRSALVGHRPEWLAPAPTLALNSPRNLLSHVLYFYTPFWWAYGDLYDLRPLILNSWMIVGYAALAGTLHWFFRAPAPLRDPARLGLALFLAAMAPAANIIPMGNTWFAPRYLSNAGIGLLIMTGATLDRYGLFTGGRGRVFKLAVIAWLAFASISSNVFHWSWRSTEAFWTRSLEEQRTPLALVGLAAIRGDQKNYEAALSLAGEALAMDPERMTALKLKAISLAGLGRGNEAIEIWKALEKIEPSDAEIAIQLALHHDQEFEKTRAPDAWAQAERYYRIAARGSSRNSAVALNNLGLLYISRGDIEEAVKIWTSGHERFPNAEDLARNLERARRDPRRKALTGGAATN